MKFAIMLFLAPLMFSYASFTRAENLEQVEVYENHLLKKIELEKKQDHNPFSLIAYEQNYILPVSYTFSPSPIYNDIAPNNQKIQRSEVKFQFSLKSPIWKKLLNYDNILYVAYTQQSFWQAYNKSAFFRANNYQPEIFLENNVNLKLPCRWNLQLLNLGLAHQSNGRGGVLERTWNRVYADASFARDGWLLSLRAWHVIKDNTTEKYNPDIEHYLGHGRILIAYNFNNQVISLVTYNNIESKFKSGTVQVSYSFPLVKKVKGYIQFFNGYGQSLLEYNHRTSALGVGISFSDWM